MLRFSVSGALLALELVQSSATIVSTERTTAVVCTIVVSLLSAMPQITRIATVWFEGGPPDAEQLG